YWLAIFRLAHFRALRTASADPVRPGSFHRRLFFFVESGAQHSLFQDGLPVVGDGRGNWAGRPAPDIGPSGRGREEAFGHCLGRAQFVASGGKHDGSGAVRLADRAKSPISARIARRTVCLRPASVRRLLPGLADLIASQTASTEALRGERRAA